MLAYLKDFSQFCFTGWLCCHFLVFSNCQLEEKTSSLCAKRLFNFMCVLNASLILVILPQKRHSYFGVWIFSTVFFWNVPSNCLPERMQSHIGCICSTFLHCAFSNVSCVLSMSNWNHEDCKSEEMTNESESMEHLQVLSPQISNHNPPEISFFSPHQNLCSSPSKSIYPFKFNFSPF